MDGVGVEPTFTESESIVLPLNEPPNYSYKYNWNIFVSQIFFVTPQGFEPQPKEPESRVLSNYTTGPFISAGGFYNHLYVSVCKHFPHLFRTQFDSIHIHWM